MKTPKTVAINVQKTVERFNTTEKYQSVLKVIENEMKNKKVNQRFSVVLHYIDDNGHCLTRNDVLFIARYLFAIGEGLSYFESSKIAKGEKMVLTVANASELFKALEVKTPETSENTSETSETSENETSETTENATENATETPATDNATETETETTPATETEETDNATETPSLHDILYAIVKDYGIDAVLAEIEKLK